MSTPTGGKSSTDPKIWLQELKNNRKTQIALLAFVLILSWILWPTSPKTASRNRTSGRIAGVSVGDRQIQALQKLPNLVQLSKAGELPNEDRMYRDLFLFDGPPPPPPPPPKPVPPPPPPPPPTPEQIAAEQLRQAREAEMNVRPQSLRYLGYMGTPSSGRLGAFFKGEEPISIRLGDLANPQWKLVTVTDTFAEFQNLKYPDLRHRIEARDSQGQADGHVTNQF